MICRPSMSVETEDRPSMSIETEDDDWTSKFFVSCGFNVKKIRQISKGAEVCRRNRILDSYSVTSTSKDLASKISMTRVERSEENIPGK